MHNFYFDDIKIDKEEVGVVKILIALLITVLINFRIKIHIYDLVVKICLNNLFTGLLSAQQQIRKGFVLLI